VSREPFGQFYASCYLYREWLRRGDVQLIFNSTEEYSWLFPKYLR
jgi:hypothetical protein